jgi:hypothetical protein
MQKVKKNRSTNEDDPDTETEEPTKRRKWAFADRPVCRRAFIRLLGISSNRLNRVAHRFKGLDERRFSSRVPAFQPQSLTENETEHSLSQFEKGQGSPSN